MGTKSSNEIFVKLKISEEAIQEVLFCVNETVAVEYWTDDIIGFRSKDKKSYTYTMLKDSESNEWKYLTKKGIIAAFEKAVADEFISVSDTDAFNIDMVVADVVTQYAVLGEVIKS